MPTPSRISYIWPLALATLMYILTFCGRAIVNFLSGQLEFNLVARVTLAFSFLVCFFLIQKRLPIGRLVTKYRLALFFILYTILAFRYKYAEEQMHMVFCSLLFYLTYLALPFKRQGLKIFFVAFVLTMFVGVTEECLQYFIPDRYFDPRDMVTCLIGAFLGMLFTWILEQDGKGKK